MCYWALVKDVMPDRAVAMSYATRSVCVSAQSLNLFQLSVSPWTVSHWAPMSMEFSRQGYWSRLPFPSPVFTMSRIQTNSPHHNVTWPAVIHCEKKAVQLGLEKNRARSNKWDLLAGSPDLGPHGTPHSCTSPFPQLIPMNIRGASS